MISIMPDARKKIGLGTVQFGLDYGITNKAGQTPLSEVLDILAYAKENGISMLDTARGYGESESTLGKAIAAGDESFRIVTKILPIKKDRIEYEDIETIKKSFDDSLSALEKTSVYGVLLHHADDHMAAGAEKISDFFQTLKQQGRVKKTGVSFYNQQQIEFVLARHQIDMVQIPMNVLDQRLVRSGILDEFKKRGIEVHVRSAFLQGLLLQPAETLPPHLEGLRAPISRFHNACRERGVSPASAALGYLLQNPSIDYVICGVNTKKQLAELCEEAQHYQALSEDILAQLAIEDDTLLNPANWGK